MNNPLLLLAIPFATWRITLFMVRESGIFGVFDDVRELLGASKVSCGEQFADDKITHPLCCLKCSSVYSAPFVILLAQFEYGQWAIYWLALSALVIIIDRWGW